MPDVGHTAPEFSMPDQNGELVTINQYKGGHNVVLSFHIFSFTGG